MSSFQRKTIRVSITKPEGNSKFTASNKNTLILEGMRTSVSVSAQGGAVQPRADVKIYGLSEAIINELPSMMVGFAPNCVQKNVIHIKAGDVGGQLTEVFVGDMMKAYGDYSSLPDLCLVIQAQTNYYYQIAPAEPTSVKGDADVAEIMRGLAQKMGLAFENHGVNVKLSNPYVANTLIEQVCNVAVAANIDVYFDRNVLAIAPLGKGREGEVPLISPQSGLIGYPTIADNMTIKFKSLFNPAIFFGGIVKLDTAVDAAKGEWIINGLHHQLESETPDGAWFSTFDCRKEGSGFVTTN